MQSHEHWIIWAQVISKNIKRHISHIIKIFVKSLFNSGRIKKKVVGDDNKAPKKPQWGIPHSPVILALLFMMMIMMTGVRQDLLWAAYNHKCAAREIKALLIGLLLPY